MRLPAPLLGVLVLSAMLASPASASKNDTLLVSRASGANGAGGDGTSYSPSVSGDGQLVAFTSEAENLLSDDTDFWPDVFVRNTVTDKLTLVDRATGANGAVANEAAFADDISASGRFVVFETLAYNLGPAVTDPDNDAMQVYVRDLRTNRTTLVSRASGVSGAPGNDSGSDQASISDDGRYVAFMSSASNLAAQDTDTTPDIFVRDMQTNTTTLITRSAPGVPKTLGQLGGPQISGDGRFVAFPTARRDLVPNGAQSRLYVVVVNRETGTSEVVSRASGATGAFADHDSGESIAISSDGRFVAFGSRAGNLAAGADYRWNDVFVRDRQSATTSLATANVNAGQTDDSGAHSVVDAISADGRYVVIASTAPGLFPNGQNADDIGGQVFVRDMKTGATKTVSRASGAEGSLGNDFSDDSAISADGRIVAFASSATNLHPDSVAAGNTDDGAPATDVFARDVLGPQSSGGAAASCPLSGNVVNGTAKRDSLTGTAATDVIYGRAGNDTLRGAGGSDCIYGQSGRDRLLGQSAADWLFGGAAADRLDGGRGNDRLRGEGGADRVNGGSGLDRIFGGTGNDRLAGGSGRDRLQGDSGRDSLAGGSGADRLTDRRGRDRFSGGSGNDRIDARDRRRPDRRRTDRVRCGTGRHDVARVDAADRVARDCERILRR